MSPATLPTGIPRLDALVMAEAERLGAEMAEAQSRAVSTRHTNFFGAQTIASLPPAWSYADAAEVLLRDLTRPESRDWAVRVGIDIAHRRNEDRPNAPYYEETRDRWLSMRETPAALALALAEVCRG